MLPSPALTRAAAHIRRQFPGEYTHRQALTQARECEEEAKRLAFFRDRRAALAQAQAEKEAQAYRQRLRNARLINAGETAHEKWDGTWAEHYECEPPDAFGEVLQPKRAAA